MVEKKSWENIALTYYLNKGKKQAVHFIASAKSVVFEIVVLHFGNKPSVIFVSQLVSRYKLNRLTHAHAKIPILIV